MPEQIDESSESSEYEKDRLAWNLPLPRRLFSPALSPARSKEHSETDDDTDEADDELASLEPAA